MKITVNEKSREIPNGSTIETLLMILNISPNGVAVEMNRQVIPKTRHNVTFLRDEDNIEIIQMVGGG
ncbi:hypothetical protein MNBD_DELTA02-970 [hydrothermal vent metagenome]|uniref:Sulfur carrier protein ThiS n=1 Tax=hydrothermal vent metagenome TaxID=652676 RepID=A0A3B0V911_9ZZZZ